MGIAHVGEADEDIADTIHALGPMEFATLFGASALRRCINRTKEALWAGVTKRPTIIAKPTPDPNTARNGGVFALTWAPPLNWESYELPKIAGSSSRSARRSLTRGRGLAVGSAPFEKADGHISL